MLTGLNIRIVNLVSLSMAHHDADHDLVLVVWLHQTMMVSNICVVLDVILLVTKGVYEICLVGQAPQLQGHHHLVYLGFQPYSSVLSFQTAAAESDRQVDADLPYSWYQMQSIENKIKKVAGKCS